MRTIICIFSDLEPGNKIVRLIRAISCQLPCHDRSLGRLTIGTSLRLRCNSRRLVDILGSIACIAMYQSTKSLSCGITDSDTHAGQAAGDWQLLQTL